MSLKIKNMKRLFLISTVLLLHSLAFGQKQVVPLGGSYHNIPGSHSFYYMLPRTAFKVEVTLVETKNMKGYYGDYARKLLGLSNIIDNNKTTYQLKAVNISPVVIPDTNLVYAVELSKNQEKKNFLEQVYNSQSMDIGNLDNVTVPYTKSVIPIPDFYRNYADLAYIEKDDSFVETKIINGVVTQVPVSKTKMVSKTTEQQAQEAADLILKIRQDRYDLLTGIHEVAYTEGAIEFMVQQLNLYENNYLGLFTGFSIEQEITLSFVVVPEIEGNLPLFSFDSEKGIGEANSVNNEYNFYLKMDQMVTHKKWIQMENAKKYQSRYTANEGYRIRNAVPVKLSLIQNQDVVHYFGEYPVYQFGKIETLPVGQDNFNIARYGIIY